MSETDLNSVRTQGLPVVASASSKTHNATRWTELTIWYREGRRPFLVEVYGGTTEPGERNRRRRRVYATLEDALAFFEPGKLANKARAQSRNWWRLCGNDKSLMPAKAAPTEDA